MTRSHAFSLASALSALALAGCDDAPVRVAQPGPETALAERGGEPSNRWLSHDDARSPTYWLIERSSGRDFVGDDPRVGIVDGALELAQARFHENRRMLANRVAQLTDVSSEQGEPMLPETILSDLSYPEKDGGRAWFGVRAQAYIVLRQSGLSHADAVAELLRRAGG